MTGTEGVVVVSFPDTAIGRQNRPHTPQMVCQVVISLRNLTGKSNTTLRKNNAFRIQRLRKAHIYQRTQIDVFYTGSAYRSILQPVVAIYVADHFQSRQILRLFCQI